MSVQENAQLPSTLLEAQTSISTQHSELDKVKNYLADERAQHERETNQLKRMVIKDEIYGSQIQILEDRNQQRYNSNESLRPTLASEAKRKIPLNDVVPARRMKPIRQGKQDSIESNTWDDAVPIYNFVLVGDAATGKSSFLLRLVYNQFRDDIGMDFHMKKMLVDGQKTNLRIWDTAGQERFQSISRLYIQKAQGILLLYDVTSEQSFLNIRAWLEQIRDSAEENVPVCIIGNKVDLREHEAARRCVSMADGETLATRNGALFCETSAKEGTNVVEAVLHLAREVRKNVKLVKPKMSLVKLAAKNAKKTFGTFCRL
ncbi:ras and EF-hand domain-containing protein-like [Stigmatopora argus]